jgi:LysM repeat protein
MSGRTIAIVVALVLALVLVLGVTGCCPLIPTAPAEAEETGPTILIDSPSYGEEVTVDEEVEVFATGQDADKISRMELWVDGSLVESQASALPGGTSPFPIMAIWVPDTPGNHTIVVRGYNTKDLSGQASVAVNAVQAVPPEIPEGCEGADLFEHVVQVGETLEGIAAGYELTAEQILACNPGLDPAAPLAAGETLQIPVIVSPEEEGSPPDWAPPADAEEPPDVPEDVEELPGEELPPAEEEAPPGEEAPPEVDEAPEAPEPPEVEEEGPSPVTVTFEALELETDQPYDNVYCMVWLADADMEQVPETGSFVPVGGNYWDIQAELAGMNSVQVPVTGDIFRVEVECFGWVGINGWSLGHFVREHGEAEWTGEEIPVTAVADDGRWFNVVYRICPGFPCEPRPVPDAPTNLHEFTFWGFTFVGFDWAGDETTIDGFRLYRNDVMVYQMAHPAWRAIAVMPITMPCGQEYNYQVTAYRGFPGVGVESDRSNTVTRTGDPCQTTVVVTFEDLYTGCIRGDPCLDITCASCEVKRFRAYAWANGTMVHQSHLSDPVNITSYSVIPMSDMLTGGLDSLTVELDPGDNLTIGVRIRDWDFFWYEDLLEGTKTIAFDDVVTGDYLLSLYDPPGPYVAYGVVSLHLEVTP